MMKWNYVSKWLIVLWIPERQTGRNLEYGLDIEHTSDCKPLKAFNNTKQSAAALVPHILHL